MMNFKINFDILKNKIARLNNLVPSGNNSNEYSHITQFTDQHNDLRFSSSKNLDENQMTQTTSYLNKTKGFKEFEHVGNNINISGYNTLIYNNAFLLDSKTSNLNRINKRKEKEREGESERNKNISYFNEGSFNIYSNRNTINYGSMNMNTGNVKGNINNTKNSHTNFNKNKINYLHKNSYNLGDNNNIHHGNNLNMNLNLNNIYLNTSLTTCGELLLDNVAQFTITPKNLDQHGPFNINLDNKSLTKKSNSKPNSKSKSSSFNISDIVDDILEMKNTPAKKNQKIVIELDKNNLEGFDLEKDLCNAETSKGSKLFKDLGTKQFKTIYDRSKDENYFKNLNLKVKPEDAHLENCINLEYITQPIKTEIIIQKEMPSFINGRIQELEHERVISDVIEYRGKIDEIENKQIGSIDNKEIDNQSKKQNLIIYSESKIQNREKIDDIIITDLKENENRHDFQINIEINNVPARNTYEKDLGKYDKIVFECLDVETQLKPNLVSNKLVINENEMNKKEKYVDFDKNSNTNGENKNENVEEMNDNPNENFFIKKNENEINIYAEPEDEEDIEADMILNEIIKNSKLKYEQEKSQLICESNKEISTKLHKNEEKIDNNNSQIDKENYLKCEEEKIEIKECPMKIEEKSIDDCLIFAEADIDPNIDFDIKDQLCSDRNSLKIIEDIIEDSMMGDILYTNENKHGQIQEQIYNENIFINQTDTNPPKDLTIECSNIEQKGNLTADIIKKDMNKINNTKFFKKLPMKKNVAISDKVITITYECKSYVPNLFQKKTDGSLLKLKIRDIDEYFRKIYKNKKPKSILKKKLPEVDEKELALKRLNDLITEFDNSKESETVNNSKSISMAEKKRIVDRNKKFIQQIESAHKSGKKFRSLNPKLVQAKKKKESENLCNKFKSNPQKFFSRPPCQVVLKSMNLKTENNSGQKLNSNKSDNVANGNNTTEKIAKVFRSHENTPDKIEKGKILMEIINNINIEDNLRELEMDSKILTHNTFSNLSWISYANTVEKEFLSKSPDEEMRLDTEND